MAMTSSTEKDFCLTAKHKVSYLEEHSVLRNILSRCNHKLQFLSNGFYETDQHKVPCTKGGKYPYSIAFYSAPLLWLPLITFCATE